MDQTPEWRTTVHEGVIHWECTDRSKCRIPEPPLARGDGACAFDNYHELKGDDFTRMSVEILHCPNCPFAHQKIGECYRYLNDWQDQRLLFQGMYRNALDVMYRVTGSTSSHAWHVLAFQYELGVIVIG